METLPKSFDDLIKTSGKPVLVDFWADWCAPCKMLSPSIARIAKDLKGRLITIKINVDNKPVIAARYKIQSIPTVMMFWKGRDIMRLQGALPYDALLAEVEKHYPADYLK
jgi:thioredoxin